MTLTQPAARSRRFVELNGLRIRLFEYNGRATSAETSIAVPTLLLLHGAGSNYLQWPPQLRRLSGMRVVAPDLPGHGESAGEAYMDTGSYAQMIRELLDVMNIRHCVIVGYSMGAAIAMDFVHQDPRRISGIGMLAAGEQMQIPVDLFGSCRNDIGDCIERITGFSTRADVSWSMQEMYQTRLSQTDPAVLYRDFTASRAFDARPYATNIDVPALIVTGSQDQMVPPSASRALHDHMPDSEFYVLEGSGHMFLWERTEEVSRLIRRLLARAQRYARHSQISIDKVSS